MYTVKFYVGSYLDRQLEANKDGCDLYVEQHFNSSDKSGPNYSVVILAHNCSQKSKTIATDYIQRVCGEFRTRAGGDKGLMIIPDGGRGSSNLLHTKMPAILLEPLFGSNPEQASLIRSEEGQDRLAHALMETIKAQFPNGAKIAFSVGHKYKPNSNDLGAPLHGGGHEADFAEKVMQKCQQMLSSTLLDTAVASTQKKTLKIVLNDQVLEEIQVEANAKVVYDETNKVIKITSKAS